MHSESDCTSICHGDVGNDDDDGDADDDGHADRGGGVADGRADGDGDGRDAVGHRVG